MMDQADVLRRLAAKSTRVITIASGKGGVGKTSFSVNLSIQLAAQGEKVILMDADLGMANIDILLRLRPKYTLADVLSGAKEMQEIVSSTPYGIKVIAGVSGMSSIADLDDVDRIRLVRELQKLSEADFIIIDTGAGISKNVIDFILAADDVMILVTPEPTSIQDAYGLIKVISKKPRNLLPEIHIVANRAPSIPAGNQIVARIQRGGRQFLGLHLKHSGTILEDPAVQEGVFARVPFTIQSSESDAAVEIRRIASSMVHQQVVDSEGSGITKMINRLIHRRM